jgi:FkbM family methyltransferase
VATGQVLFLDMREPWCRDLLDLTPREGRPYWEPDEQDVMRRVVRPGEVAFDVGANFGQHCPLLAELVGPTGRLFAFEPDPSRRAALLRTVTQHGNGRLLPYALADHSGRERLFLPDDHAMASLVNWTGKGAAETTCEVTTLDAVVERGEVPAPDFVKCDVEGAELLVFRGGRRTLDRPVAPILLYEANARAAQAFGTRLGDATQFLASLRGARYAFFWVRPGGRLEPLVDFPGGVELLNLVAVPASKLDRVS